jgi:CheY-like chemotaxis protein/anti-sigma regulatory factor (Ser/Thr protein kinase)
MDFYKKKPALELVTQVLKMSPLQEIETDPVRLRQILDNLITNAIKFTNRGTVEVGVGVVQHDGRPFLEFFVKDTGKGIPAEKCAMIFERFRQVEEHEYHEGSGLGLSISKALVGLLGGEITVQSEVGMGSTFTFTIPYAPAHQNTERDPIFHDLESLDLHGKTIFVAEDDPDSWFFLKVLLRSTNVILKRASTGDMLMKMLAEALPDLILLDINMPGKTGYECMKEIRALGYRVKVIAQTAYAMADEQQRCMDVGCDGYLAKPFNKEKLFTAIAAVLRTN